MTVAVTMGLLVLLAYLVRVLVKQDRRVRADQATHAHHRTRKPECRYCVADSWHDDSRYWRIIRQRGKQAYLQRRDKVLADDAAQRWTAAYLALPEGERYERWLAWQLTNHPLDDPFPYPAPNYPPPG